MNEKDININDCLFCNYKDGCYLTESHRDHEPHYFYVRCSLCYAEGPKEHSPEYAVERWNSLMVEKESK